MRTTHTYATLEVSNSAFKEIIDKLRSAGYASQFIERGNSVDIDMHGIALTTKCEHDWRAEPGKPPFFCIRCGGRLEK
jgi:hypothetical protein